MKRNLNLGFPYHYGDDGPERTLDINSSVARVALIAGLGIVALPGACFAVDEALVVVGGVLYRKAALEAARSSACAATGACMVMFSQSVKCGNIPAATAALCGAAIAYCVDVTSKLALAKTV